MDLALAKFVETKLPAPAGSTRPSTAADAGVPAGQGDAAGPDPPASVPVTVMGRGRPVIGGTLHTTLTPAEVRSILFDGFFPEMPRDAEPHAAGAGGPARDGPALRQRPGRHPAPGGVSCKRHVARQREPSTADPCSTAASSSPRRCATAWSMSCSTGTTPGRSWQPLVLTNPSLDLAVAWGAAYFAWLQHTGGRRIGGGIARSYYVGVEAAPSGATGQALTVLCVVPHTWKRARRSSWTSRSWNWRSASRCCSRCTPPRCARRQGRATCSTVAPEQLLQLPPLHTILRGGKRSGTQAACR